MTIQNPKLSNFKSSRPQSGYLNFAFFILHFEFKRGFTMVEMVVILAILTAISALVLFSFSGLNQSAALNRASRDLTLAVRKAQNMSLAVTRVDTPSGPAIPPAVGIRLSTAEPDRYFLFADLAPRDNKYTAGPDVKIGSDETFQRGIRLNSLKDQLGAQYSAVHIIFAAPEAAVFLSDGNGAAVGGDKIEIELATAAGQKKTVAVRTSGQISTR